MHQAAIRSRVGGARAAVTSLRQPTAQSQNNALQPLCASGRFSLHTTPAHVPHPCPTSLQIGLSTSAGASRATTRIVSHGPMPTASCGLTPIASCGPTQVGDDAPSYLRRYRAEPGASERAANTAAASQVLSEAELTEYRLALARLRFETELLIFSFGGHKALHPSHYNPDQPRVPAGNPDGGQWTRVAVLGRLIKIVAGLSGVASKVPVGRLEAATRRASQMLNRVRELDRSWRPSHLPESADIEGLVQHAEDTARQAEKRLAEYGALSPEELVAKFRNENQHPDFFDPQNKGVVAVSKFDGLPVFGVNSRFVPPYGRNDTLSADAARGVLLDDNPGVMKRRNLGWRPNDSLYHVESTILLRMTRINGGSPEGRSIDVHIDGEMCDRCKRVLPLSGRELGNPRVTYIDMPTGARRTMQHGRWLRDGEQ